MTQHQNNNNIPLTFVLLGDGILPVCRRYRTSSQKKFCSSSSRNQTIPGEVRDIRGHGERRSSLKLTYIFFIEIEDGQLFKVHLPLKLLEMYNFPLLICCKVLCSDYPFVEAPLKVNSKSQFICPVRELLREAFI